MALVLSAPLGSVITPEGRVDAKAFARQIDVSIPTIAKVLGKSPRFLHDYPSAKSAQRRALAFVDRVNDLAVELGGLKYAIAWLKTPTRELGGNSPIEVLEGGRQRLCDRNRIYRRFPQSSSRLSQAAFTRAFREIAGDELRGFFFRGIPLKYVTTPLSALGSKLSGGRYNAAGIEALIYPFARVPGAANLAVIVDRLRVGSRLRINPPDGFAPGVATEVTGTL